MRDMKLPKSFAIDFQFMIDKYYFEVDSVLTSESHGGNVEIILKKDNNYIKIVKYREQYGFYFSNTTALTRNEWFDWDIVKTYLDGKLDYSLPASAKVSLAELYDERIQIKKGKQVLKEIEDHLPEVLLNFEPGKFENIKKKLHAYERMRAKILFD